VTTNDIQEMMHVMSTHSNKLALRTTQTAAWRRPVVQPGAPTVWKIRGQGRAKRLVR